jgi:hypothetical protein
MTVAMRGPGKALVLASAAGWMALAWLLSGDRLSHSTGHFTTMWLAMILAMAPPLLLREIGRLWRASLHRLRPLTIAWFLCGYIGIWLLAGVVLAVLAGRVAVSSERITLAVALTALWLCSPARQRCLNACHRVPTLRNGIRSDMGSQPAVTAPPPAAWSCSSCCFRKTIISSPWRWQPP